MTSKRIDKEGKHSSGQKAKLHTLQNDFATPQWAVDGDTPSEVYRKVVQQKLNQYFCQIGENDRQQGRSTAQRQSYMEGSNKNTYQGKQPYGYEEKEDYEYGDDGRYYENQDEEEKAEDHESSNGSNSQWNNRRADNQYSDHYSGLMRQQQQHNNQREYGNDARRRRDEEQEQEEDEFRENQRVENRMYSQNNGELEGDQENNEEEEEVYQNEGELCYEDIVYRGDGGGNKDTRESKNDGGIQHIKVAGGINTKYEGMKERDEFEEQGRRNHQKNSDYGGIQNPNTRKLYVNQLLEARQSRNEDQRHRDRDEGLSYGATKITRNQQLGQYVDNGQEDYRQQQQQQYDDFEYNGAEHQFSRNVTENRPYPQRHEEEWEEADDDGLNHKINDPNGDWREDSAEYTKFSKKEYIQQSEIPPLQQKNQVMPLKSSLSSASSPFQQQQQQLSHPTKQETIQSRDANSRNEHLYQQSKSNEPLSQSSSSSSSASLQKLQAYSQQQQQQQLQQQQQHKQRQENDEHMVSQDLKSKAQQNNNQQLQQGSRMQMHSHLQQLSSAQQSQQVKQSQQLLKQQRQLYHRQEDEQHHQEDYYPEQLQNNLENRSSIEAQDPNGISSSSSNQKLIKSSLPSSSASSSQFVHQTQPNSLGSAGAQMIPATVTTTTPSVGAAAGDQTALISSLVQQLLVLQAQVSQQNATATLLPTLQLQIAALMQNNNPLLQLQQLQQQQQQQQLLQQPQSSQQQSLQLQQQMIQPSYLGLVQPAVSAVSQQYPSDFSNHSSINSRVNNPPANLLLNQVQQHQPSTLLPSPPLPEQAQSQSSLQLNKLLQSPPPYAISGIRSQEITPRVIRSTTESATTAAAASYRHTQDFQRIPQQQQQQQQLSSDTATPGRSLNKKSHNVSSQAKLSKIMDDILEKQEVTIKNLQKERSLSKIARESTEQSTIREDLRASRDQVLSEQLKQIQNTLHQEQLLSGNSNTLKAQTTQQRKKWNAQSNSNSMIITAETAKTGKEFFKESNQQEITGFVDERAIEIDAIKQRFKNDFDNYLGHQEYQQQIGQNNNNNTNNRHSKDVDHNNNGQQSQQQVRQSRKWGAPASSSSTEQPVMNIISRNRTENTSNIADSDAADTTPIKWEIDWKKNQNDEQDRVKPFVQSEDKQGATKGNNLAAGKQTKFERQNNNDNENVDPKKQSYSGAAVAFGKTAKTDDQREVQMQKPQNFTDNKHNQQQQQRHQQLQYYQEEGDENGMDGGYQEGEDQQRFPAGTNHPSNNPKTQSNAVNSQIPSNPPKQQNAVVSGGVQFEVVVADQGNSSTNNVSSLADAFRKRKGDLADKLEHQRIEKERQRTVENVRETRKTKEELLQIRKDLLHQGRRGAQKSSSRYGQDEMEGGRSRIGNYDDEEEVEEQDRSKSSRRLKENKRDKSEGKSISKEPSAELLNRLIYGIKAKVDRKDYQKLTTKNYHQLPEIRKKNEDLKKKQEMAERIKQKKEYEQKLRTKMRNIGSGTKSPSTGSVFHTDCNENSNNNNISNNNNYQNQQMNQQQQLYQQQMRTLQSDTRPRSNHSNPYGNYQQQQNFKYNDNNSNSSNRTVPAMGSNNNCSNKNSNTTTISNKFDNYHPNNIASPSGALPSKDQGYLLRQQYQQQQQQQYQYQQQQQPNKGTNKQTKGNNYRNEEEDYENYSDIMY